MAWTLHHPAVDAAIVGFRNSGQVDAIVAAAELDLSTEEIAIIEGGVSPAA